MELIIIAGINTILCNDMSILQTYSANKTVSCIDSIKITKLTAYRASKSSIP